VRLLTPKNGQQLVVNTPQTLTVSATCPAGVAPKFQFWVKIVGAANWTMLPGFTTVAKPDVDLERDLRGERVEAVREGRARCVPLPDAVVGNEPHAERRREHLVCDVELGLERLLPVGHESHDAATAVARAVENVRGAFDLLEALAKIKLPSRSGT
jgi:hypothetical protein